MSRIIALSDERIALVAQWKLASGCHPAPPVTDDPAAAAACIMEAVAYLALEPWSDHPQCACPVIGAFLRAWNDGLPADTRTRLLGPLVPRLVGSRSTPDVEARRSWMALDWLARVQAPAWLELAGLASRCPKSRLADHARRCRELGELHDSASAHAATGTLRSAQAAAWAAARAAARTAARDALDALAAAGGASMYASRAAALDAWDASGDAARAALDAWGAARDAALDAAWAALDAAGGAARDALDAAWTAGGAAGDRLQATVEALQVSALQLIDRMLEVQS